MVREHNVPGILAENGYHTNARDRANLQSDHYLDRLALAYLNAITLYFDGERS
jgi:N-acetylmuramoyl-L-alanine amidase